MPQCVGDSLCVEAQWRFLHAFKDVFPHWSLQQGSAGDGCNSCGTEIRADVAAGGYHAGLHRLGCRLPADSHNPAKASSMPYFPSF